MAFHRPSQRALRIYGAIILPALLLIPAAVPVASAESQEVPLWTFHPGSPDEPAWTILRLEAERPGLSVLVREHWIAPRCPATWFFGVLQGSPEEAHGYSTVVHSMGSGRSGVEASGPAAVAAAGVDLMNRGGEESCSQINWGLKIGVPAGVSHFLTYAAGEPFKAIATLAASGPGLKVTGVSSGARAFFIQTSEFETGVLHAGVFAPGIPMKPTFHANPGFAGAEVAVDRSTSVTFEDRPFFRFSTRYPDVSDASIEDPVGRMIPLRGITPGPVTVLGGNFLSWVHPISDYPSGTYKFQVNASASPGVGEPWVVVGADIWFPGEK